MNRYQSTKQITSEESLIKRFETTSYPKFPRKENDIYIIKFRLI